MKTDLNLSAPPAPVKTAAPVRAEAEVAPVKAPEAKPDYKVELSSKRPAVVFIKGMDVFSSPSSSERGYAGVGKMAEATPGARIYGWDQHKDIISHIKKAPVDEPVILVGHSFGGDTAVEVAEELDTLEHGFRKVDLLVTIDAVGYDNDIIPQNVENHLNVFGEKSLLLNDGPHVARNHEKTTVKNILSAYEHTDLDDAKEIQSEVMGRIQQTLSKRA